MRLRPSSMPSSTWTINFLNNLIDSALIIRAHLFLVKASSPNFLMRVQGVCEKVGLQMPWFPALGKRWRQDPSDPSPPSVYQIDKALFSLFFPPPTHMTVYSAGDDWGASLADGQQDHGTPWWLWPYPHHQVERKPHSVGQRQGRSWYLERILIFGKITS